MLLIKISIVPAPSVGLVSLDHQLWRQLLWCSALTHSDRFCHCSCIVFTASNQLQNTTSASRLHRRATCRGHEWSCYVCMLCVHSDVILCILHRDSLWYGVKMVVWMEIVFYLTPEKYSWRSLRYNLLQCQQLNLLKGKNFFYLYLEQTCSVIFKSVLRPKDIKKK